MLFVWVLGYTDVCTVTTVGLRIFYNSWKNVFLGVLIVKEYHSVPQYLTSFQIWHVDLATYLVEFCSIYIGLNPITSQVHMPYLASGQLLWNLVVLIYLKKPGLASLRHHGRQGKWFKPSKKNNQNFRLWEVDCPKLLQQHHTNWGTANPILHIYSIFNYKCLRHVTDSNRDCLWEIKDYQKSICNTMTRPVTKEPQRIF